ncbi:MAG: 7-carboxy-7-deazaguanine synthase QueE [Rhizobiales bacterium]|nr:7-carboxy-7-deazaguanine synthase QueE [Hyphomicrobiales bacterium]NRB14626.1 7-carboxy-7-deazaguanine synthase QueE [Hyphomicrobiales bacterium]
MNKLERPEIEISKSKTLRVVEIFGPTIQGEGAYIGRPTVFIRFGGCDYRCLWCDSMHAVGKQYAHQWAKMTAEDILAKVDILTGGQPILITISGGNPAIQQLETMLILGKKRGHTFSMETQGSVAKPWFKLLDQLTISPKPPSSGEDTDWAKLDASIAAGKDAETSLKVVVFDRIDYAYAQDIGKRYPDLPLYLSIGNDNYDPNMPVDKEALHAKMRQLIDWVNDDKWYAVTVLPQLHVLLWGNELGK